MNYVSDVGIFLEHFCDQLIVEVEARTSVDLRDIWNNTFLLGGLRQRDLKLNIIISSP